MAGCSPWGHKESDTIECNGEAEAIRHQSGVTHSGSLIFQGDSVLSCSQLSPCPLSQQELLSRAVGWIPTL